VDEFFRVIITPMMRVNGRRVEVGSDEDAVRGKGWGGRPLLNDSARVSNRGSEKENGKERWGSASMAGKTISKKTDEMRMRCRVLLLLGRSGRDEAIIIR